MNKTKRKIVYADRVIGMLAKYAIRNDPVRSLVELVTNSDDSFNRMGKKEGKISIAVKRGRNYTYVVVSDNAEGMTFQEMDKAVGGYGFETSGFLQGKNVRGLFGRGLKEAILGLGTGIVRSIKDGEYTEARLDSDGMYEIRESRKPNEFDYKDMFLEQNENGTQIVLELKGEEIKIPQFENLKDMLQKHVSLRDIMTNSKRKVVLNYLNRGIEERLMYKQPKGETIIEENLKIEGFKVPFYLKIIRAEKDLLQGEDNLIRDGGLLIRSGNSIHEATLFRYDDNQYAKKIYGEIRCDYINDLIRKGEAIISDKRDGLDRKHSFTRALKYEVEKILDPIIQEEKRKYEEERGVVESLKTVQRFNKVVREFNDIAKNELKNFEGTIKGETMPKRTVEQVQEPIVFQFSTPYSQIVKNEEEFLYLHASVPVMIPAGTQVKVTSDNEVIEILDESFTLEDEGGTTIRKIKVIGKKLGEAMITATAEGNNAECKVKVIKEREKPEQSDPKRIRTGLFKHVRFNNMEKPNTRASFEKETGTVEIYTKNPSVAMYTGKNGENQEDYRSMVLVAELVTDVVCRSLTRIKDERGMIPYMNESVRAEAMINELENLKTKYADRIHKVLVIRQRGRQKKE